MAARYVLSYSAAALAYLEGLPRKQAAQIIEKISRLSLEPTPPGSRQLHGMRDEGDPVRRIRQGNYRILYATRARTVTILDIGHRKDVYG